MSPSFTPIDRMRHKGQSSDCLFFRCAGFLSANKRIGIDFPHTIDTDPHRMKGKRFIGKEKAVSSWIIQTMEYDVDLARLLEPRLLESGAPYVLSSARGGVGVRMEGRPGLLALSKTLAEVLVHDLAPFEVAAMADETPLPVEDRRQVLHRAVNAARQREDLSETVQLLMEYLTREGTLCLEGFLRFRMRSTLLFWRLCVEEAFSGLLLEKEYAEAADVLRLLLNQRPPRCPALRLCLHGNGLCSLSDEGSLRMEYVDETGEGILSLLVGMAPARLIVYDLSGGARKELVRALTEIFSGRVCLYTGEFP